MSEKFKKILLDGDAATLGTATPQPVDGTAASPGAGTTASKIDHIHALGPLVADLNFNEKEADAMALQNATSGDAIVTAKLGRIYFDTTPADRHPYIYIG